MTTLTLRPHSVPFQTCLSSSPSKSFITSLLFKNSHHNNNRLTLTRLHVSTHPHASTGTTTTDVDKHAAIVEPYIAPTTEKENHDFDWYAHWYPLDPICDLDKKAPKARTVLGLDVVIWWDRVAGAWKVLDDRCPHRLAPLSEGRIDDRGRLQCVYHGWCFDGAGACKYIPQAPALGPPVHKNEKACVAVYPSIVQNNILWFWPNTSSEYKDIVHKTRPPYVPELDDPSFNHVMMARDVLYGYELLAENLVDPAHVPYAHYGIMGLRKRDDPGRVETDKEGGTPIKLSIEKSDISGFDAGYYKFIAPCLIHFTVLKDSSEQNIDEASPNAQKFKNMLYCIPVSPGRSRVITVAAWNFGNLKDKLIPRLYHHMAAHLVIDSDLYILHAAERKLVLQGSTLNWQNAYYLATQSDAMVVAFRSWLRKYSKGRINWRDKDPSVLPASPPREQLMDRYWSHVVHCKSCSGALRTLKAIRICIQVVSVALIGVLAAANPSTISNMTKATIVSVAIMSVAASHWLSQFIHKTFYYHDYNHTSRTDNVAWKVLGNLGNFIISSL